MLQVFANSLVEAAELSLVAIGVTTIFGILNFANFAQGSIFMAGAYLAFLFNVTFGLGLVLSIFLGTTAGGLFGVLLDRLVFLNFRRRSIITLMVVSLGLTFIIRSVVRLLWGTNIRSYDIGFINPYKFAGCYITPLQLAIIGIAIVAMILLHLLLHQTILGKAMRATSNNLMLAEIAGVNTERIIMVTWFLSGSLTALGGILSGLDTVITPMMGFKILLPAFTAAILGGIGNVYGAILGTLALALAGNYLIAINFGALWGGQLSIPAAYKPAIAFAILIVILFVRPQGLLGSKRE